MVTRLHVVKMNKNTKYINNVVTNYDFDILNSIDANQLYNLQNGKKYYTNNINDHTIMSPRSHSKDCI